MVKVDGTFVGVLCWDGRAKTDILRFFVMGWF